MLRSIVLLSIITLGCTEQSGEWVPLQNVSQESEEVRSLADMDRTIRALTVKVAKLESSQFKLHQFQNVPNYFDMSSDSDVAYASGTSIAVPILLSGPMDLKFISILIGTDTAPNQVRVKLALYRPQIMDTNVTTAASIYTTRIPLKRIAEAKNMGVTTGRTTHVAEFDEIQLQPGPYFVGVNMIGSAANPVLYVGDFENDLHMSVFTSLSVTDIHSFPETLELGENTQAPTPVVVLRSRIGQTVAFGRK